MSDKLDECFPVETAGQFLRVECAAGAPLPIRKRMRPGDLLLTHYSQYGQQLHFFILPAEQRGGLANVIHLPVGWSNPVAAHGG